MNIYNLPKYCTYLTIYSGDKLPPFYIGSGTISKIFNKKKPYRGSVKSKKYSPIWKQELKENPHLFKTIVLEKFYSRKNAMYNERLLQIKFDVVKSEQFINMAIASKNFADGSNKGVVMPPFTKEHRRKLSLARKKRVITEETKIKMSNSHKGKSPSEETRKKLSKWQRGLPKKSVYKQESKDKQSAAMKGKYVGKNNPMFGIPTSQKQKSAASASTIKRNLTNNPSNIKCCCVICGKVTNLMGLGRYHKH